MPKDRYTVSKKLEENLAVLEEELGYGVTFDLVFRRLKLPTSKPAWFSSTVL